MKKLVLIFACILGLVFSGFSLNQTPQKKEPAKTEAKKEIKEVKKETVQEKDAAKKRT